MRIALPLVIALAVAANVQAAPAKKTGARPPAKVSIHKPPAPPGYAKAFDFKGIPLGITLDQFKVLPFPDDVSSRVVNGKTWVDCRKAGDPYDSDHIELLAGPDALNLIKCGFYGKVKIVESLPARTEELPLNMADSGYVVNDYSFDFIEDPDDHQYRLYHLTVVTNRDAQPAILTALTEKFGKPQREVTDSVQNKAGASFPRVAQTWVNSTGSVTLTAPGGRRIDEMALEFLDTQLSLYAEKLLAAERAKIKNPI